MNKIYVHNVNRYENENSRIKAFADVTIGNAVTLKGIKLIANEKGVMVGMPSSKGKDKDGNDKYFDKFYAKSEEARTALLDTFLDAHNSADGYTYAYANGDINPEFKVTVSPVQSEKSPNLKAWATLNIGDEWIVKNIAVKQTEKGLTVNFPAVKGKDKDGNDKFYDIVKPEVSKWKDKDGNEHSKDYGKVIRGLIINAYKELKPALSEQIGNAEKSKGADDVGSHERAPEIDAQSLDDLPFGSEQDPFDIVL